MTTHKNVHAALARAQSEMTSVLKGSINPHFKSKYADLADVYKVVLPPLNNNGLALYSKIVTVDGEKCMRTVVYHGETDTCIECDVPLIVQKNDMQGMKSATTYAKRIGAESICGIAPEDDDGNAAVRSAPSEDIYMNTKDQDKKLTDYLTKREIPGDKQRMIKARMMNRHSSELDGIINEVISEPK